MIQTFSIDNTDIACWTNPRNFGAYARSLVFIHGSGGDHTGWSCQYSKLHKQFNIMAIDLPGHGQSLGQGENEVDKYVLWMKKLLDKTPLKNPILIGHSLGAAITLSFALHYPQDIKAIVPVGGGIKMPVNPALLTGLKTNPTEVIDLICKFSLAKENRPKLFIPLKKSFAKANTDVLYNDLFACSKLDLSEEIKKIQVPALIICGMEDKMTPVDFSRRVADSISGSQLSLIAGAGHMVMMEKPAEFNAALSQFASSIS